MVKPLLYAFLFGEIAAIDVKCSCECPDKIEPTTGKLYYLEKKFVKYSFNSYFLENI